MPSSNCGCACAAAQSTSSTTNRIPRPRMRSPSPFRLNPLWNSSLPPRAERATLGRMQQFADRFPALAAALGPQNLAVLTRAMTMVELPAGRRIIRDRMPVDSLYFVLEGRVSILIEEGGRAITLGELGPGEWLGEVSVLSGEMLASSTA